jgi:hypothetical protein
VLKRNCPGHDQPELALTRNEQDEEVPDQGTRPSRAERRAHSSPGPGATRMQGVVSHSETGAPVDAAVVAALALQDMMQRPPALVPLMEEQEQEVGHRALSRDLNTCTDTQQQSAAMLGFSTFMNQEVRCPSLT